MPFSPAMECWFFVRHGGNNTRPVRNPVLLYLNQCININITLHVASPMIGVTAIRTSESNAARGAIHYTRARAN